MKAPTNYGSVGPQPSSDVAPRPTPLRSAPPVRLLLLGGGRRGESPHHGGGHRAGTVQPLPRPRSSQGGLEDVHACVDLTIHLPVAHLADEHLAHPISAPSATHGAGLTGPRGIDFDDGNAFEGGLVFNLPMDFATRPRR